MAKLFLLSSNKIFQPGDPLAFDEIELITVAMWASEPIPFDPMEIALHQVYKDAVTEDERNSYQFVKEYPLGGKPPMMTQCF